MVAHPLQGLRVAMVAVPHEEFVRIAAHFRKERDQILSCWRQTVDSDPAIGTANSLAHSQFIDHVPRILDAFERSLRARGPQSEAAAQAEELAGAAEHGEHRWLHGYDSRETLREWGHLHLCMLGVLESFATHEANVDAAVLREARAMLAKLSVDCMVESAVRHAELERAEAEGRLFELERVLERLRTLERERTELWREAAHDLRGNVGAVKLAASALGHAASTPELPAFVNMVRKSADSLDTMLNDLIELARLEAGREQLNLARFNARTELAELCESLQPLAASHRLFLKFDAPAVLVVDGDAVKVRRIAQNLVLNALKYTDRGGVLVSCSEVTDGAGPRWSLTVKDTGAGMDAGAMAPLAKVLSAATRDAAAVEKHEPRPLPSLTVVPPRSRSAQPSEGVGLSIVKRLCELLNASMELETQQGRGTTFRIVFPRRYSA